MVWTAAAASHRAIAAAMQTPEPPDFTSPAFLLAHAHACMEWFSRPACLDERSSGCPGSGGWYHSYRDDGSVVDEDVRHLVSSTRLVVQYSWALRRFPAEAARWSALLARSFAFLGAHRAASAGGGGGGGGGHAWTFSVSRAGAIEQADATNYAYGLAFSLLACASAARAGLAGAAVAADEVMATLSSRLWEPAHSLYADEADARWARLSPYRGQNANMHACEAHMAAFAALRQPRHLARARAIARAMCVRQAGRVAAATGHALVYEHYSADWQPDLEYNRDKPDDRFKPWGFQPGHLLEWAKLLLQLQALAGEDDGEGGADSPAERAWRVPAARALFEGALAGWDEARGGFVYSLAPPSARGGALAWCNARKYKWVQLEGAVAARLLARALPAEAPFFMGWYQKIWAYCWAHMIDHVHGGWFRALNADNSKIDDLKSPPGKVEYHATGACYDIIDAAVEI